MKTPSHKKIYTTRNPIIKYVPRAHAWCMTSWENGEQKRHWYSDEKCNKPITFSDKKFI